MGNIKGSISSRNIQKCHLNSLWYYTAQPLKFHKSSHCTLIVSHFTKKFKFTATTQTHFRSPRWYNKTCTYVSLQFGRHWKIGKTRCWQFAINAWTKNSTVLNSVLFPLNIKNTNIRNSFYYVIIHSFSFIQMKLHEGVMVQVQRKQFLLLTCVHI